MPHVDGHNDTIPESSTVTAAKAFVKSFGSHKHKTNRTALRYPLTVGQSGTPFIMFSAHKALYTRGGTATKRIMNGSVAMYLPQGIAISDTARYETASIGLMGGAAESVMNGRTGEFGLQDAKDVAVQGTGAAVQSIIAGVSGLVGGGAGAILGGAASGNAGTAAQAIAAKKTQTMLNPNEFMLFKAPGLRQFGFNFTMIPVSAKESDSVLQIIQKFRRTMYPTSGAGDLVYKFPEAFTITTHNTQGIPRLPECVLTSATTTYNPNSMSYFKRGNRAVEVTISLSFQELMPIQQANVDGGF